MKTLPVAQKLPARHQQADRRGTIKLMSLTKLYYTIKFMLPRPLQLGLRRSYARQIAASNGHNWPIDEGASRPPEGWAGWPEGKQFALILTHDVECEKSLKNVLPVAAMEDRLGFRSSFNFVARDYPVPAQLRHSLDKRGFEIGVHGLHHHDNPFRSRSVFRRQSREINHVLKEWGAVGFRSPSMYHDLDMLHEIDIEYDASTFDTDPFEPQPDGMGTIFPFWVPGTNGHGGYVELPYTLPQDFLLFILRKEKTIHIWKTKLDWIADRGGMALFIVHPGYISFDGPAGNETYPVEYYEEFLEYIRSKYAGQYWNPLPREIARFWKSKYSLPEPGLTTSEETPAPHRLPTTTVGNQSRPIHACMLVYSFYESDNRVIRYAETLANRGDSVDVVALTNGKTPSYEKIRGVNVYRIQKRTIDEVSKASYLLKLAAFLFNSSAFISRRHLKKPYDLIHVHSVPDFEVFATLLPKLRSAKIILDIHDIVPEFYASKFGSSESSILFKSLLLMEKLSCRFADHVIISNHLWEKTLLSRSVEKNHCTAIMNYPDNSIFHPRPRKRKDGRFIMLYPGTLGRHQGLDIAIRAFALIKDQAPEAEFHIYGRGPEKQNLNRLITELDLEKRVFLLETVPLDQIGYIMANADLGIIPKRNDSFGGQAFSTKILEFMSLGVPVIVAKTRIDSFYFDDSVLMFFNPGDEQALAECMITLRNDKALRERLSSAASDLVKDYSWEKKQSTYCDLVDRLVQR